MEFEATDKVILISAMRGSGKSVLTKHLLDTYRDQFNGILVISPSDFNNFYKKDGYNVMLEYDENVINKIMDKMMKTNEGKDKSHKDFKHFLIVLDDCIADINFNKSPALKKLIIRGRHFGISILITTQYIRSVPPIIRNNTQYYFLGRQNRQSLEIVENELNIFKDKKEFMKMLRHVGENYTFLIINTDSKNVKDMYGLTRIEI